MNFHYSTQAQSFQNLSNEQQDFLQDSFQSILDQVDSCFYNLDSQNFDELYALKDKFKDKDKDKYKDKKCFVQVGIGGSALGPKMIIDALGSNSFPTYFLDNIDPDQTHDLISQIERNEGIEHALFFIVSKSGSTAETISNLSIVLSLLQSKGIESKNFSDYLVFCTDPNKGPLLELGKKWSIPTLFIPPKLGGRFSVLSPVGLFPSLFSNIKIADLFSNFNNFKHNLNSLYQVAHLVISLHQQGLDQTVLMPYSSKLRSFSDWFVQLWAESLGKKSSTGKSVGLTPISAYGATDQHSQMQLFMEGPANKLLFFIHLENFKNNYSLNCDLDLDIFNKYKNFSLAELMEAEYHGTLQALEANQRPFVSLNIKQLNAPSLGELILFFESLTVLCGKLLEINPYDQPGVEAGKKFAFDWLEKRSK